MCGVKSICRGEKEVSAWKKGLVGKDLISVMGKPAILGNSKSRRHDYAVATIKVMLGAGDMRQEFWAMFRMGGPLALTEVGWLTMGFVDTVMVGRLPESAVAIGAVSLGSTLFAATALVGSSVMLGLDTLIAQAFGAGKLEDCHRTLWNALYLAIAMSPVLMAVVLMWLPLFHRVGIPAAVVSQTIPFVNALTMSTLPLSIYFVLRRYLQAMG